MSSAFPTFEQVKTGLGDEVLDAVALSVADAGERLRVYRQVLPEHASEHSQRGLANMINDWLWASVRRSLGPVAHVALNAREPTREIGVGLSYRLRVKRHRGGRVSSYPTPTFLDFQLQGVQMAFPGMDEIRLNVGYRWHAETRSIGEPVISLPHGDEVIWLRALDEAEADVVEPIARDERDPDTPLVELIEDVEDAVGDEED